MDMRQLRYFAQIVESGSLAKASRQLFIAQPALTQQVARLEGEVGKPLLVRTSRGVTPTDNGAALYQHAKFMLRQLDQAIAVARGSPDAVGGHVALGLAPTTNCQLGLPLIRRVRERWPNIRLKIVESLSGHLDQLIRAGQLDLAVLFNPQAAAELVAEAVLVEELFLIVPAKSRLVAPHRKSLKLAEVARLPLVLPGTGHGLRRRVSIEFERLNVILDPIVEVDSLPLLMRCVAAGMGATIKPMSATLALDGPQRWRALRISDAVASRTNYLYALPEDRATACTAIVHEELRSLMQEQARASEWQGVKLLPVHSPLRLHSRHS